MRTSLMDYAKKLDFVLKMTKHALDSIPHFDAGGTVLSGTTNTGVNNASPTGGLGGAIGGVFGTNNDFQASGAPIVAGTNVGQLNNAYTGAQGALNSATNQVNAVQPGVSTGVGSQNYLASTLQNQIAGGGPNLAQATLNQNTGQNIAQAAALAAGTRGASTNAGLIAENAARQGAATQQSAISEAATLRQNQQLQAQQQLQTLAGTQVDQGNTAVNTANSAQQGEQNILQNANTSANNQQVTSQNNINSVNAQVAAGNQNSNQNVLSGIGSAVSSVGGLLSLAHGGEVPDHIMTMAKIYHQHLADGGAVQGILSDTPVNLPQYTGNLGKGPLVGFKPPTSTPSKGPSLDPASIDMSALSTGIAPAVMAEGGQIAGKPKVNHDSYSNDTKLIAASPGEVVIPLDVLHAETALGKKARFVAQNIARKNAGRNLQ